MTMTIFLVMMTMTTVFTINDNNDVDLDEYYNDIMDMVYDTIVDMYYDGTDNGDLVLGIPPLPKMDLQLFTTGFTIIANGCKH